MRVLVLAGLAFFGCNASAPESGLALTVLTDTNPAPDVFEAQLVAAPASTEYLAGKRADVWAYRDGARAGARATIPGPLIDVKRGDKVIIHLRNELPDATTIHWHGIRVPAAADGTTASQMAIEPGASFDYVFTVDDPGTFWYHPHTQADVQIERGLYGALIVRGDIEPAVEADRMFVLDDIKLESTGQLSTQTNPIDVMLGRPGNVLLVNGKQGASLAVKPGSRERWRFVNSANGRYFNLRLPGHTFLVIGWDGGLIPQPYETETLLVAPGERYEVLVTFAGASGSKLALETIHYDRGHDIADPGPQALFTLSFGDRAKSAPAALPAGWGPAPDLVVSASTPVRPFVLSEEEHASADPQFFINGLMFPAPTMGMSGDLTVWSIRNDAEMDHPFHLHGMFFQVLDIDGVPPAHAGWKDTVNVPQKKTLRFAVVYGTPGTWMFHCHILEHAERGMMSELMLEPRP
jgi:FtsP/CotA-like multicopper oxidase with cupredoxin domain